MKTKLFIPKAFGIKSIIFGVLFFGLLLSHSANAQPNLWGMTSFDYSGHYGVIYCYNASTDIYTVKHFFDETDGGQPSYGLIQASDGLLYGVTDLGGDNDAGVIFKIDPANGNFTKIHDFYWWTGTWPSGTLLQASDGLLYGMTNGGGDNGYGVIYKIDPNNNDFTKIHDFNGMDGGYTMGGLMQASNGLLYGMTYEGGDDDCGVIFKIDPTNNDFTKIHDFDWTDGIWPINNLIQASNGLLYGMTYDGNYYGVIFKIDPADDTFTKTYDFNSEGRSPCGGLFEASDGLLYGMTYEGGDNDCGVLFKYEPLNDTYTKIADFNGTNGANPYSTLMQASDGLLYGYTTDGGSTSDGNIFKYDITTGILTGIYDFDGTNGNDPFFGSLVEVSTSVTVSCTTPVTPLNATTGISVNTSLEWNSVPEADAYLLYFGTDNPPTNIEDELDVGNVTSYTPCIALGYDQTYYWQVIPYNSTNTALGCDIWSFTTEDNRIDLDLTVYLEGPYDGTDMDTDLNPELIPLSQPYNDPLKWDYQGMEIVDSIPNVNVVDWVLIELRETTGDASTARPGTMIARQAAFLLNDGSVVGLDGTDNACVVSSPITNNLFVVIYHRNHLEIMSANPLSESGGVYTYDFTTPEGQAYGTDAQKNLGGNYGMYAGDGDANDTVEIADINNTWNLQAGKNGYYSGDFDMDSEVNNIDKNDVWLNNIGMACQMPVEIPVICGDPFTDYRDGQSYNTVQIGTQCWMSEYLNIGTMVNGNCNQSNNSTIEKYCYGNNTSNCDTYGGLYQWNEIMQYVTTPAVQGICPAGWHLPTDDEWKTMEMHLGMTQAQADATGWRGTDEGGKLKEFGTDHWTSPNTGATNSSGFTALPTGHRNINGNFWNLTNNGQCWSSSENGYAAWNRYLEHVSAQVWRSANNKMDAFGVRCVLD